MTLQHILNEQKTSTALLREIENSQYLLQFYKLLAFLLHQKPLTSFRNSGQ